MILPGTPNERIGDLRTNLGLSQKELSKITGIAPSQLSRIENGEIKSISSDILIKLANAFHVSTDYILGLTTVSVPKSYDISDLGLSEGAVKNLLTLKNSGITPILNRLLEHKRLPALIAQMKAYFHDEVAMGVLGVNKMFELATTSLEELRKEQPDKSAEIREGMRLIKSETFGAHEIDIERLKNTFVAILRDIKSGLDGGELPQATVPADIIQQVQSQLPEQEQATPENIANIVTQIVGQTGALDGDQAASLQTLMTHMLENLAAEQSEIDFSQQQEDE